MKAAEEVRGTIILSSFPLWQPWQTRLWPPAGLHYNNTLSWHHKTGLCKEGAREGKMQPHGSGSTVGPGLKLWEGASPAQLGRWFLFLFKLSFSVFSAKVGFSFEANSFFFFPWRSPEKPILRGQIMSLTRQPLSANISGNLNSNHQPEKNCPLIQSTRTVINPLYHLTNRAALSCRLWLP